VFLGIRMSIKRTAFQINEGHLNLLFTHMLYKYIICRFPGVLQKGIMNSSYFLKIYSFIVVLVNNNDCIIKVCV
jgi:hypothetical protein